MNFVVLKDVTISLEPVFDLLFQAIDTINIKVRIPKAVVIFKIAYRTNHTY